MDMYSSRALIIDDEAGIRRNLRVGLSQQGFNIDDVDEGLPALALIDASFAGGKPYDYVVSDINLPDVNGLKLLDVIKSRYPELPVVIISGYGNEATRDLVKQKHGDGYLEKPFAIDELTAAFSEIDEPQIEERAMHPATDMAEQSMSAYCMLKIKSDADTMAVFQKLYFLDNVLYCDAVRDAYDVVILLNGQSHQALKKMVESQIKTIEGVEDVHFTPVVQPFMDPQVDAFLKLYDAEQSTHPNALNATPSGNFMSAYVLLEVNRDRLNVIYPRLHLMDEVVSCDATDGHFDLVLLVKSTSDNELKRFISEKISPIAGIVRSKLLMVVRLFDM